MKIIAQLLFLSIVLLVSCSDDSDSLEVKTNLLVDIHWYGSEVVGTSPGGYALVSPIVFKRDKTASIGGTWVEWAFVDNGQAIKITYPSSNSNKYVIQNLTTTEFQFKHFDNSGNFLAEVKYDKCNPLSVGGC
jgi:hypothetical protein